LSAEEKQLTFLTSADLLQDFPGYAPEETTGIRIRSGYYALTLSSIGSDLQLEQLKYS